jgi:hypothetical protein
MLHVTTRAGIDLFPFQGLHESLSAFIVVRIPRPAHARHHLLLLTKHGLGISFLPASIYCYTVGYNLIHGRKAVASLIEHPDTETLA